MPIKNRKPEITNRVGQYLAEHRNKPLRPKKQSSSSKDSLDADLLGIGTALSNLNPESPEYKDERKHLRKRASLLTRMINRVITKLAQAQGKTYNEKLGVFVVQSRVKEADEYARVVEATYFTARRPSQKKLPIQPHPFELDLLKEDLTKGQWYAVGQVRALTGGAVPAGFDQLSAHIKNNKHQQPLIFSYLKIPDNHDSSLNHFVSIHIDQARNEITYVDPDGKPISREDQRRLQKTFPNAKICYLDENGKKLDQKTAERSPDNILRVQYDVNSCGMYSTRLTKAMKDAAQNNDVQLDQEIDKIRKIKTQAQRQIDSKELKMVYRQVTNQTQDPSLAPVKPKRRSR